MNSTSRSILGGVAAVLAVACGRGPEPSFDFVNGPASPGNSGIFRVQETDFFIGVHPEAGLIAIHGLQNTMADLCSGLGQLDIVDFQLKPHTSGEIQALITTPTGSVQILPLVPLTCGALSSAPVLYRGSAALRNTDNNFTPTGTDGQRANSFGWTSHGVLDDLAHGGQVSFREELWGLLSPADVFTVVVSRIDLTPIH